MNTNAWVYKDKEVTKIPDGYEGFIYLITNLTDGKMYVGKKQFLFSRTKIKTVLLKNGTKKKKKVRDKIDSDWMDYYGSSDWLKEDIEKLGKDKFRREILYLCKTKSECSYLESYEIFIRHALLREDYYNSWISCKIHKKHVLNKLAEENNVGKK